MVMYGPVNELELAFVEEPVGVIEEPLDIDKEPGGKRDEGS
jgi:hypothetical protein